MNIPDWLYKAGYYQRPKKPATSSANVNASTSTNEVLSSTDINQASESEPRRQESSPPLLPVPSTNLPRQPSLPALPAPESGEGTLAASHEADDMQDWEPIPLKGKTVIKVIKVYRKRVPRQETPQPQKSTQSEELFPYEWIGALGQNPEGKFMLNIKWQGRGYESMTWEPFDNIHHSDLEKLWNGNGTPEEQVKKAA